MVVASFSGQKIDVNSYVNSVYEAKTIFPVFISCLTICSVKVAVCPVLQQDKAQCICVWSSGKSDAVSDV
jgi:hypothetical protein